VHAGFMVQVERSDRKLAGKNFDFFETGLNSDATEFFIKKDQFSKKNGNNFEN
jgi:hypothetical protein